MLTDIKIKSAQKLALAYSCCLNLGSLRKENRHVLPFENFVLNKFKFKKAFY